jgi:hypothetical protein
MLSEGLSLVGFIDRCLIPYLYRFSYLVIHGEAPFEDLEHGVSGIKEDLRQLLRAKRESEVLPFIRLLGMKRPHANKERCPCGSGDRLGRCHHRHLNRLRERLGRYWFRIVEHQRLNEELTGKSSGIRVPVMRWRPSDQARSSPHGPSTSFQYFRAFSPESARNFTCNRANRLRGLQTFVHLPAGLSHPKRVVHLAHPRVTRKRL